MVWVGVSRQVYAPSVYPQGHLMDMGLCRSSVQKKAPLRMNRGGAFLMKYRTQGLYPYKVGSGVIEFVSLVNVAQGCVDALVPRVDLYLMLAWRLLPAQVCIPYA